MCNILWVGGQVVDVMKNLQSRIFKDQRFTKYKHKGCDILYILHVIVWDQKLCDNTYITHVHHVVCVVALKYLFQETRLWSNTFSLPDARYINDVEHNTPYLFKKFTWNILCFPLSTITCLSDSFDQFFEIYVLKSRQYFVLLCALPYCA